MHSSQGFSHILRAVSSNMPAQTSAVDIEQVLASMRKNDEFKCLHPRQSATWRNVEGEEVRRQFQEVLGRNKQSVPLTVCPVMPTRIPSDVPSPSVQADLVTVVEDIECLDHLAEENYALIVEASKQGVVPLLIIRPRDHEKDQQVVRRPVVILIHSTNRSKEKLRPFMQIFASRGYLTAAIDCRYHGGRADSQHSYKNALVSAWKNGEEMPFIFDTVWDLLKVVDYLSNRCDVDPSRIGITGFSLGGMVSWFTAALDTRIAVAVPILGVQSFKWAIENDAWLHRVKSIPHAFEEARKDLGKSELDTQTVTAVFQHIAPGVIDKFDSENTIPAIAPRPLLIINGEEDPRCPVPGLKKTLSKAACTYQDAGVPNHFQFVAEEGVGHEFTEGMLYLASDWFDRFLNPGYSRLILGADRANELSACV